MRGLDLRAGSDVLARTANEFCILSTYRCIACGRAITYWIVCLIGHS